MLCYPKICFDIWAWEAVDKAYTLVEAGTYRMLEPQLKRLCLQRRPRCGERWCRL